MIRSGWHAEWDAYVATAPLRAEAPTILARIVADFRPFMEAMARVQTQFGVSAAQAARSMRGVERALRRASLSVDDLSRTYDVPPWMLDGRPRPRLHRVRWRLRRRFPRLVWPDRRR